MKKEWLWILLLSLCLIILLPWSVLRWRNEKPPGRDFRIRVLLPSHQVETLPLEEYLVGVLAAEMPADFASQALEAQAVAARTYAAKRLSHVPAPDPGYDVDTTVKTQAWLNDAQMRQKWGWFAYWRNKAKLEKAVQATRGEVLVYNGDYIDAFYFSSCGRKPTERAEDVWGSSRPYLQNVSSEEQDPLRFVEHYTFTRQQLAQKLGLQAVPRALLSTDFEVTSLTAAGRAKTVTVLGRTFQANQFRLLLGLASTDIEWAVKPDELKITTYGKGHAVGLSQYGANDMARRGATYQQILAHFYPGAKIMSLSAKNGTSPSQ
ncbi:amidase enhancer precursor [Peptococcaceae bacterium CEB3]|nr:amidase enhancer precursor [Peptococcaceae bacterium CEB3]